MRKITVLEHITLDGVIQGGGGPDEDPSNGFAYGGWVAPFDDEAIGAEVKKILDTYLEKQQLTVVKEIINVRKVHG